MADDARALGDGAAWSRRIDLVIARFLRDGAVAAVLALERADNRALRRAGGIAQRQRHLRVVAGLDDQLLHVGAERAHARADLVVTGEQRGRAELTGARVD